MSVLSKTRSVLDLVDLDIFGEGVGGVAMFERRAESDERVRRRAVAVDYATYVDLGSPKQVTVTIEPGDTLTPESTQRHPWVAS